MLSVIRLGLSNWKVPSVFQDFKSISIAHLLQNGNVLNYLMEGVVGDGKCLKTIVTSTFLTVKLTTIHDLWIINQWYPFYCTLSTNKWRKQNSKFIPKIFFYRNRTGFEVKHIDWSILAVTNTGKPQRTLQYQEILDNEACQGRVVQCFLVL